MTAAIWREIGTEEPQPAPAFLEALSALVGRWLIARSSARSWMLTGQSLILDVIRTWPVRPRETRSSTALVVTLYEIRRLWKKGLVCCT